MDAGSLEAAIGFEAGADIVSVLGAAESTTIRNAAQEAHRRNRRIMVDLIALIDLETRVSEVERIGVDYICCHTAYDVQTSGTGPLEDLRRVAAAVVSTRTAVAGGVTPDRIEALVRYRPEILIVGGFVAGAKDPEAAAQAVRQAADLATGSKAR
jgi:3-hexulose-6-phosphate synthase